MHEIILVRKRLGFRVSVLAFDHAKSGVATTTTCHGKPTTTKQPQNSNMSIPSTPMAPELARYKLETEFYGKTVVHTTIKSDLSSGLRKALFKTAWIDDGEMGSGAFGVVREEINAVTFDRRAVKVIAKRHFKNFRELETMAALQDVSIPEGYAIVKIVMNIHCGFTLLTKSLAP